MFNDKKYIVIWIAIIVSLGIFFITYFNPIKSPASIIEHRINLVLPKTSEIINFSYNRLMGAFDAKVQIDNVDVDSVKIDLLKFFGQEYDIGGNNIHPYVENIIIRLDIDKNNIESCYSALIEGEKHLFFPAPKTENIWVFLVKQNDEKYCLYISYF